MSSSLFGSGGGSIIGRIGQIRDLVGGNPQAAYEQMMRTNPQFAEFVRQNQGKTPEQIASEHGIDLRSIGRMLGM